MAKELEAEDIELKDYIFTPKEITVNGNSVIDYTDVENDKVFLCNRKDILDKPRPSWIPELDAKGLALDKFLPVCVKDFSDGNYFVQSKVDTNARDANGKPVYKNQIYKMSSDVLAATVDYYLKRKRAELKREGSIEKVSLPRGMNSMPTKRYNEISKLCLLCNVPSLKYKDVDKSITDKAFEMKGKTPGKLYHIQNEVVFLEQWQPLLENIKGKRLDMNYQKQDYIDSYSKAVETAYGDKNTFNNLYNDYGVKIKKQNGSNFSKAEIDRLSETIEKVFSHYGNLSILASDYGLKISYADNCMQFASKNIGVFSPFRNVIGVSFFNEEKQESVAGINHTADVTLSHEVAHWLDNQKGKESHSFFASDKYGTLENQIAEKFKNEIKLRKKSNKSAAKIGKTDEIHLGEYWFRTCECFARAMEQYYALQQGIDLSEEISYARKDNFETDFVPLIEQLMEENKKLFSLSIETNQSVIEKKQELNDVETSSNSILDVYIASNENLFLLIQDKLEKDGLKRWASGYYDSENHIINGSISEYLERNPLYIIPDDKAFIVVSKNYLDSKYKDFELNYLNENLELEIKNEQSGLAAKSYYNSKNTRKLCHIIKEADRNSEEYKDAIEQMADYFVKQGIFNEKSILVPAPQHTGKAEYTWHLAAAISQKTNSPIADILRCKPHETLYEQKKNGIEPDVEFYLENAKGVKDLENLFDETTMEFWKRNKDKVYLLDNNISTGLTFNKAEKLLPGLIPAPYAIGNFAEITFKEGRYTVNNLLEEKALNLEINTKDKGMDNNINIPGTDLSVLESVGFNEISDIKEIKNILKTCSKLKTEIKDFYKDINSENCRIYRFDGNVPQSEWRSEADGTPLYVINYNGTWNAVQDKTALDPGKTFYHVESFPGIGGLIIHFGEKTNLSHEEAIHKELWVKCPNNNIKITPEKILELGILSEKDKDFYRTGTFDRFFYQKLKSAIFENDKTKTVEIESENKNERVFTVIDSIFSAVDRADFLSSLEHYVNGEKKGRDIYKIKETLNKEDIKPVRFIFEGYGYLGNSIYESFVCKNNDNSGYRYLMIPHNAEFYKGFDKLLISEKTFSDIDECQEALIDILVNLKENHNYKIETETFKFYKIPEKFKQPLLTYIADNEKEICNKTEEWFDAHPDFEKHENIKDNISVYLIREPETVNFNSPQWLKIFEKIELSINNPLRADTIEVNTQKENKLMEETKEIKEMTQAEKDSKILLETYGNKKAVDAACKKASVSDFVSTDKTRYFMTGIFYEKGFAIATDGRMLIKLKKDYPAAWEGKIIDPNTLREIEGTFPAYEKVFPNKDRLIDRTSRLAHISNYLSEATAAIAISEKTKRTERIVPVMFENTFVNPRQLQLALSFARDKGFNKVFQEDNYKIAPVPVLDENGKEVYKYYNSDEKSDSELSHKYYSFEELPDDVKNAAGVTDVGNGFAIIKDHWYYDKVTKEVIEYENNPEIPLSRTIEFDAPDGSSILIMPVREPEGAYIDKDGILKNYEEDIYIKTKLLGKDDELCKNIIKTLIKDTVFADSDVDSIYKKNLDEAFSKQNPDIFPKNKKDCQVLATVTAYTDVIGENLDKKDFIFEEGQSTATLQQFICNLWLERFKDYAAHPEHVFITGKSLSPDYTIDFAKQEKIIKEKELGFEELVNDTFEAGLKSETNNVSKKYSFFVKDTAEFEQFADFEPITNLSAEEAVKTFIEQKNKDLSAGIGINIPGDFIFDDPNGEGAIILQTTEGKVSFYMGDNFVRELKENNVHAQNVIAAFKELDEVLKNSSIAKDGLYIEPSFLYEKEKELFINVNMENRSIINSENIKLNNITKDENGFYVADLFIPDADYIKEASISDERFAMPVATWKDNDPNINISIVKRMNSDPHNKDIEYMDYSSNGNPSIFENEKWNLVREQKTFDLIGEQIKQYKQEINTEKTETATEVKIIPVTLDDILGVMEMRPEFSDSGKIMIYDEQRKEYIDNGQNFEGSGNEVYEFESAAEIFERLDIYINDYYIHDMEEQLEACGIEIKGNESLSDLCKLYKTELEKGNEKLSLGELNLAMGIVEPDTVIYEQHPLVEKNPESTLQPGQNVSLDNFDHKKFFDVYHSSYDEYYNTESKELLKEQSEKMWRFDELMKSNPQFKEIVSSLVVERKDPFSSDRECAAVVKAFETMGIDLDVGITQEETKEIRPAFFLYGDTPEDKIVELKEHLSMNGYDIKWKDKTEDNNLTGFTCSIDEKAYVQTILEERGIDYGYELGLLANGFDAAWLDEDEQLDAEIVTEEEFKRINELREKEFKDLKLPYIKITYTEGSTENHKSARIESGTVFGLKEGEEILKELNNRFNTFLKCDVTVNFPDAKENEPGSYSLRYDFHDDKITRDDGKEIPFEREGLSDYIRMTCSYPEVLEKYEEQWQKVNASNITEEQKKLVADIIAPNYEKLKNRYNEQLGNLNSILDVSKKLNSSWIVNASEAKASKDSIEKEQNAIAVSFERYAGICMNHIADYLDENKDISFKDEFLIFAKHQISNMLQDVKYGESRNAKYGEHGYDFDFTLWRHSLEKVMDASEYNSFFTERLQIEEKRYKEIRNAAKDMGMTKEETYSLSNEEWRACDELAEKAKMDWWFEEYGSDGEIHKNVSKQDLDDLSTAFDGNLRISRENEFIVRKLLNDKNISFNETYLLSSEEANAKAENLYGFRFEYNEEEKVVDVFNNNTNAWLGITDESGFNYAADISPDDNDAGRYHIPDEVFKDVTELASQFFTECRSHSYDFASLADDIIQQAYENSGDGFNYIMDFNTVAGIAGKDVQWVKNNITNICDALYKFNDNFLLEFNEEEALAEENEINMYFCSVGEDANELFKKGEDGRWIRKTDEELRQENLLEEEIDKGIESIQANGGMSDAAIEADYEAQIKEQEAEIDNDIDEEPVWIINGEPFTEKVIEESLHNDVVALFEQYDSGEAEKNLTLVGVKMYRNPTDDGKISLLVEFDSKNPENRWREDSLFNALNEEGIEFNGMKVDFNPITREKSGTIEQYLKTLAGFENEEQLIKVNAQKLEEKEVENKLNEISSKLSEAVDGKNKILPFSIINNKEKGRVNIKFDTVEDNPEFNDILKELKANGWKYAPSTKQWYPVGNAVNKAEDFANRLQEKYSASLNKGMEKPMDIGEEKSPYDGIRFFDRNYNEPHDFALYFNSNLHLFKKSSQDAITEEEAATILKAVGSEKHAIAETRNVRVGLDMKDNIVILTKSGNDIEKSSMSLPEFFEYAKESARENLEDSKQMLENYLGKEHPVKDLEDIFVRLYETCIEQCEQVNSNMQKLYDSFYPKENEVSKSAVLYQRNSYRGWEISADKDFKKSVYIRPFEQTDRSGYILMAGKEGKDGFWQEKFIREMLKSNNWSERAALIETLTTFASDKDVCNSLGIKEPQSLNGFLASIDKIIKTENDTDIKAELLNNLLGPAEAQKLSEKQNSKSPSKESIPELTVGDSVGKDKAVDVFKIADGVYQATLSRDENGAGSAQNYFVIDNSIVQQLNSQLKELVVSFDSRSVIENKAYEPYILRELISKNFMPPRDEDFVQKLDEYISVHPLKYEKLKPVDYLNFEKKLKEIAEVDKEFNKTPFELGQQLVALVDESDRPKLMDWLKNKQGCDSPENMKRVFASWLREDPEQKKDVNRKKENGYPPRGEN